MEIILRVLQMFFFLCSALVQFHSLDCIGVYIPQQSPAVSAV